jgi:Leucine-rich repeat (LRR) protein
MIFLCCFKSKEYTPKTFNANNVIDFAFEKRSNYNTKSCSRSNEFGQITEIYLVDKSITELSEQLIYSSRNIVRMWLKNNKLKQLPAEVRDMKALCSIWLSNNLFEDIPILPETIKNIYIDNNFVDSIGGIEKFTLLETLKIDCCKLKSITDEIGQCTNLITLEAHKNNITTISSCIGNLSKLKTLSLHSNLITQLPEEIGNLSELSYCSLHFNDIGLLPLSMSNMTSLLRLSLHNNQVISIASINICNLQVVSLFRNNIEEIPEELCKSLVNCEKFAIQQNKLVAIPRTIKYMVSLDTLWIYDNKIAFLPDELNNLPKLNSIWLNDDEVNRFTNIKSCLFKVKAKPFNE